MRKLFTYLMLSLLVGGSPFITIKAEQEQKAELQKPKKEGVIKGRVLDHRGQPLPGVTILMKNYNGGYITNLDGKFTIITKRGKEVLTFSFMGFKKKTITARVGQNLTIKLEEDREQLDEVVVTGFAPKSKLSYTGSQTTIKKDQLLSAGTKNLFESLETVVPGMMVVENAEAGADPNKRPEINIRGRSTFEGKANMPVFIVDGSEVTAEYIYDMDINDIENVTVLKDASASALYGAKASAGVIVITTKTLEGGRLKLNYSGTMRLSTPDLSDYHLLNARQKLEYERLAGLYKSTNQEEQYNLDNEYARLYNIVQTGLNTDWLSKPLRNGVSQSHSLSLDGGDKRAKYNVGIRYANDQGVMKGSKRDRLSSFFKLSYNIPGKFYIMNSSTISLVQSNESPYGSFGDYVKQNPYEDPYNEEGILRKTLGNRIANPLYEASLGSFNKNENFDFINNTNLQVWFAQDFRFSADFSFQKNKGEHNNFLSPLSAEMINITDPSLKGRLTETYSKSMNYQGKMILSYNKIFGKLYLSTMAGATIESADFNTAGYKSVGFYTDKLAHPAFSARYPLTGKPSGSDGRNTGVGFFFNLNTMYDNKYFIDVIYRYEGSSKFGKDQRFAPFWSVGGGWNLHNEKFFKNLGFSLLKLRASVGYLGNISFDPYQAMTTYSYADGFNYVKGMGAIPLTIGNPNLKWQRTLSKNIGLDVNVIKGRLDFSADYYIKDTDDLLLNVTKAPSVGIQTARENLGAVENQGFELRTSFTPIRNKDLQWTISLNYSYNKNKIKRISNALKSQNEENINNTNALLPLPIYEEGQSLTALKVVPSAGIDPATGREVFIKRDGSYTFDYDAHDKVVFGDTSPLAFGSINSYLTWKGFSLNASFGYSLGGVIYNQTLVSRVEGSNPKYNADERVFNDRWKEVGDKAKYKDIADRTTPKQTSRFVETNNYLTLRSLTLAYDLPTSLLKPLHVRRLRLQLMSRNLFYLSSVKQERGLSYPFERSYELGLRFSL